MLEVLQVLGSTVRYHHPRIRGRREAGAISLFHYQQHRTVGRTRFAGLQKILKSTHFGIIQ